MIRRMSAAFCVLFLLCVLPTIHAEPEGGLIRIFDAAYDLLFNTDNVTLEGSLDFSMNDERFKTVRAKYIQNGYDSVWDYRLFTPRYISQETFPTWSQGYVSKPEDGSLPDRESGFTIIHENKEWRNGYPALYSDIYVIEVAKPNQRRLGSREPQSTLVRRSAAIDQLNILMREIVRQTNAEIGPQIISAAVNENGITAYTIHIDKSQVSPWANSVFSLITQKVISRVIKPVNYDLEPYTTDYHYSLSPTIADEIATMARSFSLNEADFVVTADQSGLITSICGKLSIGIVLYNSSYRDSCLMPDEEYQVDIQMDVKISDYGSSHFDLTDYWIEYGE